VIVSLAAAQAAGMATDGLERRTVRIEPIEVVVLAPPDEKVLADEHHV
jgi:hypothetical protein